MKIRLWHKVLVGMILGISYGFIFKENSLILKPIATIFMNLVKMIVVPTVFFAILYGITSVQNVGVLGKIGFKATCAYISTTMFAVTIGIFFSYLFKPGSGIDLSSVYGPTTTIMNAVPKSLSEILINIVPTNPVAAMASGNTLQIVFFAFLFGIALIIVGEKAGGIKQAIVQLATIIFKLVDIIMKATPYGVFAIMACLIGEHGFTIISILGKLVIVVLSAFFAQYLLFGVVLSIAGLKPWNFYKKTFNIQALALATSSSKATISTSINDLQTKVGVSETSARFVLPLGASINMDGSAIYISACALFFAQATGISLSTQQMIVLIVTSTIGSIGAAGYPSGGVIMLTMVLHSIGLPIDGIALILGIDRLLDMFRTTVNVTGDCFVTVLVDKLNGTIDIDKYNE